jgi:oligosaccharide repeat unit polymerase
MVFLIVLSGLLFLASQKLWRRRMGGGYSPAGLYALIWGVMWLVFWSGVMGYQPLSKRCLWYSAIPVFSIFMGEVLAVLATGPFRRNEWHLDPEALRRWSLFCGAVTLFAGAVTFAASWISVGNVFKHAQELKLARVSLGMAMHSGSALAPVAKYDSILLGAFFPATVLGVLRWRLEGRKAWGGVAMAFAGSVLFDFGWGSRVSIFYFVLLMPPVSRPEEPKKTRPRKSKKLLGIAVAILVLIVAVAAMNVVGVKTRERNTLYVGGQELPFSLVQLIDYNIGTLAAFDYTLDENKERTWGRVTFFGFEQWLRLFRLIPRSVPIPPQLDIWQTEYVPILATGSWDRAGNVFTWLRFLYTDFGVAGLIAIPFVIGWAAARSTARGLARGKLWSICFACALYFTVLTSGGASPFRSDSFIFGLGLSYFCARAIAGVGAAAPVEVSPHA